MKNLTVLFLALSLGTAAAQTATPPDPARVVVATAIPGVIVAGAKIELVRAGFNGTEGAIGMADGSLLFCEQMANKVIKLGLDGQFTTYLEDANRSIGLAYDKKGTLIAAQSREPRIGALMPARATLSDAYGGQPLVRPNDLVMDRKGGIYFTDPIPTPQVAFRAPPPGRRSLLLYITPKGETIEPIADYVFEPNGLELSPNEKTLYLVNGDHIDALDVAADGHVKNPRKFADARGDGLAMDSKGRLYAANEAGISVISPKGEVLGLIPAPVRIQSLAFAGKDRKTLFAVGSGAVYKIQMLTAGVKSRAK
jgi:gluconolactonase